MALPFLRKYSLAAAGGDGRRAYVNGEGAFLGSGVPLLERDAYGRFRPRDPAVLEALLAKGYGAPVELGWHAARLRHVAEALNKGDLALAGISLVHLDLPPLPSDEHAQAMAEADGLLAKFNPDQPRAPKGDANGGQWVGGDADEAAPAPVQGAHAGGEQGGIELAADREDPTHARKRLFVEAHLADAQKAAAELHVPVENILGMSALESEWGKGPFAANGRNNYFGTHYPTPRANGFVPSAKPPHPRISTYDSYAASVGEFVDRYKKYVDGVKDPEAFARILQRVGKFGVDTETGAPRPGYAKSVAATARSLRRMLDEKAI
jgi:hypothetical protein